MKKYIDDSRVHEGHRSRMHEKLIAHGRQIFDTYELLEMLLYQAIPYRDTNPVAKNLLYAFGGLDGVFNADVKDLVGVAGIGEHTAEYLLTVGKLSDILGAEIIDNGGVDFSDYESVGKFLTEYFIGMEEKQTVALFLDSSMRPVSFKKMYDLEYESGGVKAKPFIDEAIKTRAVVVITAHNHPYGPFYPTPGDRATNNLITDALNLAGIIHAEHYLVSGEYFAGLGSLQNFTAQLSQMPAVNSFIDMGCQMVGKLYRVSSVPSNHTSSLQIGYNLSDSGYFARLLGYCVGDSAEEFAHKLLKKYLTIENTLTASIEELSEMVGKKAAVYIKLLAHITSRRVTEKFRFGIKHSTAMIAEYLKAVYIGESVEKMYMILFDSQDRVIGCNLIGEGTVNMSEILPRKAIETAVKASASSVSIAHNHPFGTTQASKDDISLTRNLRALFSTCEIELKDHFVIAGQLCDMIFCDEIS